MTDPVRRPRSIERALAVVTLLYLLSWWGDFSFFFTDGGPLPLAAVVSETPTGAKAWSLYSASIAFWWPYLLFAATHLAALVWLLGGRGQAGLVWLWLLVLSLQNRVPILLSEGDRWLWLSLTWALWWHGESAGARRVWRAVVLGVTLVALLSWWWPLTSWAALLGQGPRASGLAPERWQGRVVPEHGEPSQWDLPTAEGSWRRRWYWRALSEPQGQGLRAWYAWYFYRQQRVEQPERALRRVELYSVGPDGAELVARWPSAVASSEWFKGSGAWQGTDPYAEPP